LVTLLITPMLLKYLGATGLSVYLLALSITGIGAFLDLGLSAASVSRLAEPSVRDSPIESAKVLDGLLSVRAIVAGLIAILAFFLAPFIAGALLAIPPPLRSDAIFVIRAMIVGLGLSLLAGALASLPRAAAQYDLCAAVSVLTSVLSASAVAIALVLGGRLKTVAAIEASSSAAQLFLYAVMVRRLLPNWLPHVDLDMARVSSLAKLGGAFYLGTLASAVLIHGPRIMVARTLGVPYVAAYAVPWNITFRVTQLAYAASETLLPVAKGLSSPGDIDTVRTIYKRATLAVFVFSSSICVPMLGTGPDLLALWLGISFSEGAAGALQVLSVGAVLHSLAVVPYFLLCAVKGPGGANTAILAGSVLSCGALGVLLPHGVTAGAAGLCAGLFAQFGLLTLLACRAMALDLAEILRPLLKPAIMAVAALVVGWGVQGTISSPPVRVFVAGLLVLGVFQALLFASGISASLVKQAVRFRGSPSL